MFVLFTDNLKNYILSMGNLPYRLFESRGVVGEECCMSISPKPDHFHGKTALRHLAEVRSSELSASLEVHGAEASGPIFAFLDSFRETIILVTFGVIVTAFFELLSEQKLWMGIAVCAGWCFWKGVRGAHLAWSRLRRMHRVASEEQREIQTNRSQEREELVAMYGAKGFSGPLLDQVVDVLMADQDRLLKVMLQEEMGLRLEENPHPVVQGFAAAFGVVVAEGFIFPMAWWLSLDGLLLGSVGAVGLAGACYAVLEEDNGVSAFIWNGMFAAVSYVLVRVVMEIVMS